MSRIDYNNLKYDSLNERIAEIIADELNVTHDISFFRFHTAHYFSLMAAMMRVQLRWPGGRTDALGNYTLNLAPSGYGKGVSQSILEEEVVNTFREKFLKQSFPTQAGLQLERLAHAKAQREQIDYDLALSGVKEDYKSQGKLMFSFEKPTEAALKQGRTLLQMTQMGSLNLITDEIASNLFKSRDAVDNFLTLYDGRLQNNYNKHTKEQMRADEYFGKIGATMLLFGVGETLLTDDALRETLLTMLRTGYARRMFFCYVKEAETSGVFLTPEEELEKMKQRTGSTYLAKVSKQLGLLADNANFPLVLDIEEEAALTLLEFNNDSRKQGQQLIKNNPFPSLELRLRNIELVNRKQKVTRLAATYAFVNGAPEVQKSHVLAAIKMELDSYKAFETMVHMDDPHVQIAKYLAAIEREVTQPHLIEHIPNFRKAKVSDRESMLTQATAWGYTNSILVKRRVSDNVEFIKADTLKKTDLNNCLFSYSQDIVQDWTTQTIPFDRLFTMAQAPNFHWINHELEGGYMGQGYRHDDNIVPGFNLVVIDVDSGVSIQTAQRLLQGYKALYYLTKSHTPQAHRFRIILPTNYVLELGTDEFAEFMQNLFEWLPFKCDDDTGHRCKKWISGVPGKNSYMYCDGQPINVLPFVPLTSRQEEHQQRNIQMKDLDRLQRWFALNTFDGVRNNNLLRYALVLIDVGFGAKEIEEKLFELNDAIKNPVSEKEISATIMSTVRSRLATVGP